MRTVLIIMRTVLIILSPVYIMVMIPFIWLFESLKTLCELFYDYIDFLRNVYIPEIKEMFKHTEKR